MADGHLNFDTKIDESGFNSGVKKLGGIAKGGLSVLGGAVAGVTAAMGAGVAAGVKYNAGIEQYQTSFEVMTGSADKAASAIEDLKKVGAETPFELNDLADTTQLLMNYGFGADDAMSKMMMLGDISQGSSDKMKSIATAYGQMSSAGKVSLEDVKQMIEAGFNPLQEISESTGESMASLYERISDGSISVDEITASMTRATSEGGKYFQSMEKQSQTVNGLISTLKDNAQQLLGEVVKPITEGIANELLPEAIGAMEQLTTAFQEDGMEGLIEAGGQILANLLTGIVEALPGIIDTAVQILQSLITALNENASQIMGAAVQILGALVNGLIQLLPSLLQLGLTIITSLGQALITNAPQLITYAQQLWSQFILFLETQLPQLITTGGSLIANLISGLLSALPSLIAQGGSLITQLIGAILANLPSILEAGGKIIGSLLQGLVQNGPQILANIGKLIIDVAAKIGEHLPDILQKGVELIGKLLAGIVRAIPDLLAKIPEIISDISDYFHDKDWGEIGLNIIRGIASGIANAAGELASAALDAVKSAWDSMTSWLDIHSPSRKARDVIGKNWALGIGVGFQDNMPIKSMTGDIGTAMNKINEKIQFGVGAAKQLSGTTGFTGNVYTSVISTKASEIDYDYLIDGMVEALSGIKIILTSKLNGKVVSKELVPLIDKAIAKEIKRKEKR